MAIRIPVSQEILNWAVQQSAHMGHLKTLPLLKEWQEGKKIPTYKQIQNVSDETRIPFGYFFLKTPPKEKKELLEFRTIESKALQPVSRDLLDTITDMERIVFWTKSTLISEGFGRHRFVGRFTIDEKLQTVVRSVRESLKLEEDWFTKSKGPRDSFNRLRAAMEKIGILILMDGVVRNNTRRVLDVSEFRAFAIADEYAPLIFINRRDSEGGKLFSLLHECVHLVVGSNHLLDVGVQGDQKAQPLEGFCNAVTAEILVPLHLFDMFWKECTVDDVQEKIRQGSEYFSCSTSVIAHRALETNKINRNEYQQCVDEAIRNFQKKNEVSGKANFYSLLYSRMDSRFFSLLYNSVMAGKTSYTEAFRLTHTNLVTFEVYAQKLGLST